MGVRACAEEERGVIAQRGACGQLRQAGLVRRVLDRLPRRIQHQALRRICAACTCQNPLIPRGMQAIPVHVASKDSMDAVKAGAHCRAQLQESPTVHAVLKVFMAGSPVMERSERPPPGECSTATRATLIWLVVSVPVLSLQMTVVQPRVSTEGRLRAPNHHHQALIGTCTLSICTCLCMTFLARVSRAAGWLRASSVQIGVYDRQHICNKGQRACAQWRCVWPSCECRAPGRWSPRPEGPLGWLPPPARPQS